MALTIVRDLKESNFWEEISEKNLLWQDSSTGTPAENELFKIGILQSILVLKVFFEPHDVLKNCKCGLMCCLKRLWTNQYGYF